MSCFGNSISPDLFDNCCNANNLCKFDGCLDDVVSTPIYVQSVYDAALFHLQGMKTVKNQRFTPCLPGGTKVLKVVDIRTKKFFNPANVDDPRNLNLDLETSISGATVLQNCNGDQIEAVGPDGTLSQKILYADTTECDDQCKGTTLFGSQNVRVSGNILVFLDLLICDNCNNEGVFSCCAEVNIAPSSSPLVLTNFFEICMPNSVDTAFLPRFTEFSNADFEVRLATNNCGRDLSIGADGEVMGNLIIACCVTAEKKIVVPVQLCVLSTGFAQPPAHNQPVCNSFPTLFPDRINTDDTAENCRDSCDPCGDNTGNRGRRMREDTRSDCRCNR